MSGPPRLSDAQWERIAPHLPPKNRRGRPRADDRQTLDAILFVLTTGCHWMDLPREYGSYATAFRRLQHYQQIGLWERLYQAMLAKLEDIHGIDWSLGALDATFAPAKRGAMASD